MDSGAAASIQHASGAGLDVPKNMLLGRHLKYLTFSLMASIRNPIYQYFSKGFRGQPRVTTFLIKLRSGSRIPAPLDRVFWAIQGNWKEHGGKHGFYFQ